MKISAKHSIRAALAILSFLPGLAGAACNDANGNQYTLTVQGPDYVEIGSTNEYALIIRNAANQVVTADASAVTWSIPAGFTQDPPEAATTGVATISLIAQDTPSTSTSDKKTIQCEYNKTGWKTYTESGSSAGCEAKKKVTIFSVNVLEVDFRDSVDSEGEDIDNNFDLLDDEGQLIVDNRGPEWTSTSDPSPTIYIRNSKVRVRLKFSVSPLIAGQSLSMKLFSEGDLDFTPSGTKDHDINLTFDASGFCTSLFLTYEKTISPNVEKKTYTVNWKGAAKGITTTHDVYSIFGVPVENFSTASGNNTTDVVYTHLRYLLGPKIDEIGEWCIGKSTMDKEGDNSIPYALWNNIFTQCKDSFDENTESLSNPWTLPDSGNVPCESYADLMFESLNLLGVTGSDRRSVTSAAISKSTWMGAGATKLVKAFRVFENSGIWFQEGVCGVQTDSGKVYYDVIGQHIGLGNWLDPTDGSGNNLWFEPTSTSHGPIMYEFVDDYYGSWEPISSFPFSIDVVGIYQVKQIKITSVTVTGNNVEVEYRTEGAKNLGTQVQVFLMKYEDETTLEDGYRDLKETAIAQKWDNKQVVSLNAPESGRYCIRAYIATSEGDTPSDCWEDEWAQDVVVP